MLGIYTSKTESGIVSTDDTNPLFTAHNRRQFHPWITEVYLRNSSPSLWFSNIQISATATNGTDIYSGSGFLGIKFYQGDLVPTERTWASIDYNQPIEVSNLGEAGSLSDTSVFLPFYIRVEAAANTPVSLYAGELIIQAVEHSV